MIQPLSIQSARELLDFSGGVSNADIAAEQQLQGSVALHNILAKRPFAYLADEVGMGKTYVALGTIALFRHFQPHWRVLYITPRENIQHKWLKELRNFTANNWRITDNRVRSFQGAPAYGVSICHSLLDFAHQAALNPRRDFILRLTSFSFGLGEERKLWVEKRKELIKLIPWLSASDFSLRDKEEFKTNFACALNAIVPHFDLIVVDECHNLKHGFAAAGGASRNRLLSYLLGVQDAPSKLPHYSKRFERVLALSATPLESDYRELWNQQDLFGCGESILVEPDATEEDKKKTAEQFLVRRLARLNINGLEHTKNMYRREWRNGGVHVHDEPLQMADDQQKLIVALVQKKVAEILGNEKFNHSFQIGMLASFESFLETARVKSTNYNEGVFDNSEQTESDSERDGVDTNSVNQLARSYRQRFGKSLPHPKMDAVADSLKSGFVTGAKSLVFVRRVKSVSELTEKLNRHYDTWLKSYLAQQLDHPVLAELERAFKRYETDRRNEETWTTGKTAATDEADEIETLHTFRYVDEEDEGANENFFAWFFRGKGPKGIFSGAAFNRNRLISEGSTYSTFFEDNYVQGLLGGTDQPVQELARHLSMDSKSTQSQLRQIAYNVFRRESHQSKFPRLRVFWAYQEAAMRLLAEHAADASVKDHSAVILRERFSNEPVKAYTPQKDFPEPDESLLQQTFFTELIKRPQLREALWPHEPHSDFTKEFRRREQRRELLVAAARLGHPFVDLWALAANGLGSLALGVRESSEARAEDLLESYLSLLERQSLVQNRYTTFRELSEIAQHFDLILAVNFPTVPYEPLKSLPRLFGRALARQTPVGGMSGGVNKSLVQQFRMPGYPLFLITTDVLQEGEDLHTFCSQVIHYGIAWTPSALEQRTGRVDRIRSLSSRRLQRAQKVTDDDLLQVYYPHLHETVERLQVERVYERMNRFIRLMHHQLASDASGESHVDVRNDIVMRPLARDIKPIEGPLDTPFDVKQEWMQESLPLAKTSAAEDAVKALSHFQDVIARLLEKFEFLTEPTSENCSYFGTIFMEGGRPILKGQNHDKARHQPLTLYLRTDADGEGLLLRCVSPIGQVAWDDPDLMEDINALHQQIRIGKICAISDAKKQTYDLTIELDMLFHLSTTQFEEVSNLVERTAWGADQLEKVLLNIDEPMTTFRLDLLEEPRRE